MKNIFQFMVLPVFLILVIFSPAMAKAALETNDNFDSISWWLRFAVKQVDNITDPKCKDEVCGHLGRVQALAGDIDGSNATASAISPLNKRIYIYTYAAKTFYKQGNMSGYKKSIGKAKLAALSVMSIASQIFMNANVVGTYLDCNDVNGAKSFVESIKDPHRKLQLHKKIAAYLACNNDIENTDAIIESITNKSGKESALVEITETCVREGNLSVAEQMAVRLDGSKYKDRVYGKIGVAFAKNGNIRKARSIAQIIDDSMQKSSVTAAIAKYQITSGDIDLGKKTAREIGYRDHKISVYSLIAEKQVDAEEIESAVVTIKTMAKMIDDIPMAADKSKFGTFDDSFKKGMAETVYLRVAKNLAEKDDIKGYNKYIAKAIAGVKAIDDIPLWKGNLFVKIVGVQAETGDIEGAKKTAKEINDEHNHSWALFNIVQTQLKKGDVEEAVATSKEIIGTMHKSFAYGEIASAFVKKGELAEAKKVLLRLGNSSREAEAYRRTATAFIETGYTKELANWLNEMPSPQARVYVCIGAVDGIMKKTKASDTLNSPSQEPPAVQVEGNNGISILIDQLGDKDPMKRSIAMNNLARIGKPAVGALIKTLKDENLEARKGAAHALAMIGPDARDAIDIIENILYSNDKLLYLYAAGTLTSIEEPPFPKTIKLLKNDNPVIRRAMVESLLRIGPEAVTHLIDALKDEDLLVRWYACIALKTFGPKAKDAIGPLTLATQDDDKNVRHQAIEALKKINPTDN